MARANLIGQLGINKWASGTIFWPEKVYDFLLLNKEGKGIGNVEKSDTNQKVEFFFQLRPVNQEGGKKPR